MKLKESAKCKLSAILLVIFTGLAFLTSCQKEQIEVVNPPVQVVVEQNYSEDIIGDWNEVSITYTEAGVGSIVEPSTGFCAISDMYRADGVTGFTDSDCNPVWDSPGTVEWSWEIDEDSLYWTHPNHPGLRSELTIIQHITDTEMLLNPVHTPNMFVLYERVN